MRKNFFLFLLLLCILFSHNVAIGIEKLKPSFQYSKEILPLDRKTREVKRRYKGKIFDVHTHLTVKEGRYCDEEETTSSIVNTIKNTLDEENVSQITLMSVPNSGRMENYNVDIQKALKKTLGKRMHLLCCTHYVTNWTNIQYESKSDMNEAKKELKEISIRLKKDLRNPLYSGIGEIAFLHFNKKAHQALIEFPVNYPPFLKIIDKIANSKKKNFYFYLHAEPIDSDNENSYHDMAFGGAEFLFKRYPHFKWVSVHTAMTSSSNVRKILKTFPKLMMDFNLKKSNKRGYNGWAYLSNPSNNRWEPYEDWAELMEEMPNRFMVGTDTKFCQRGQTIGIRNYRKQLKRFRKFLGALSSETAKKIAYKNAEFFFNTK
ncbi:MAG: hypothetical protein VX794_07015 [Nitrospinota bacterium]|nr:hypothetical protein [Nitrospinota bacterium]